MTPESTSLWQRLGSRAAQSHAIRKAVRTMLFRRTGLRMLTCGYAEDGYPEFPLAPEEEADRHGYQLYHRLVRYHPIQRRDVLEVGCGSGAGARFLAASFHAHAFLATDPAGALMRDAQKQGARISRLTFAVARAARLPVADASQDIVIGIEVLSTLEDKPGFLREAARVLRPGGRLLLADCFDKRAPRAGPLGLVRGARPGSPLLTITDEDWTARVLRAIEADSPRRLSEIQKLPAVIRAPALSLVATTASPSYQRLRDGDLAYLHFVLRR